MKKICTALRVALLTLGIISGGYGRDGQPLSIMISQEAPAVVRFAAAELQEYLKRISGQEYPILSDATAPPGGRMFLVGQSKYTAALEIPPKFSAEAYIIKSAGGNLVLAGDDLDQGKSTLLPFDYRTTRKGSLFAVYDYLQKFHGLRWFWPGTDGEVVPAAEHIVIPEAADIYAEPAFLWRHIFWVKGTDEYPQEVFDREIPLWCMRNQMGLAIGSPWSFAHSWGSLLTNRYFDSHPEYYALVNGKRTPMLKPYMGRQVCTSNPAVVQIFADQIRKDRPQTDAAIVSISPNDGLGFCECPDCRALDHPELYGPADGYQGLVLSDRIFTFANQVAKEVKKTHPRLRLGIFSYTVASTIPRALAGLEDNIVISMTQTNANYRNQQYKENNHRRLLEWKQKCSAFVGREYLGNYSFAGVMHPQTKIIAEDLRFMREHNYLGFYSECTMDFAANFLNYYLTAKLTWNPEASREQIIEDLCRRAYGPAATQMQDFYTLLEDSFNRCTTVGIHPGNIPDWYSQETLQKAGQLLAEALDRAGSEAEKNRVRYNQTGFDYTCKVVTLFRLYQRLCDSGLPLGIAGYTPDYSKKYTRAEIVEILSQARTLGREIEAMLAQYAGTSIIPAYPFQRQNLVKRWFASIDDYWQLYAENSDRIAVIPLPEEWKFKTDPGDDGSREGWQAVPWNDTAWDNIRTDECWEKQGYADYNGLAWYRQTLELPGEISGKYTLRIGAVDESCWVFVNGQPCGEYIYSEEKDPDAWKKPHYFAITGSVRPGLNSIAIKVHDAAYAGGIWRPVTLLQENNPAQEGKTIFREDFQQAEGKFSCRLQAARMSISADVSCRDGKALQITVDQPHPAGASLTIPDIIIAPEKEYLISLSFKSAQVQANAGEESLWLKKPRLPNARIIFLDKEGKRCTAVQDYIWFGLDFKEQTAGWELVRKVFKSPAAAEKLYLTVFLNAAGEYWLDQISVEEL